MSEVDSQILTSFVAESKKLVGECLDILERVDGHPDQAFLLENFSNRIDRIMGASKSLAPSDEGHSLHVIGQCAELCKILGSRATKLSHQTQLFNTTVSFLIDATEHVGDLLDLVHEPASVLQESVKDVLVDRLKWLMEFVVVPTNTPEAKESETLHQKDIDALMKKLGM